jgi:hypothetical protein
MWTLLWAVDRCRAGALLCVIRFNFDVNFGSAALEWNSYVTMGGLYYGEILMLTLGGLHVKHTMQHGIRVTTQNLVKFIEKTVVHSSPDRSGNGGQGLIVGDVVSLSASRSPEAMLFVVGTNLRYFWRCLFCYYSVMDWYYERLQEKLVSLKVITTHPAFNGVHVSFHSCQYWEFLKFIQYSTWMQFSSTVHLADCVQRYVQSKSIVFHLDGVVRRTPFSIHATYNTCMWL